MKTRNITLTTVLSITVIGLLAMVTTTSLLPGNATAGDIAAKHFHGGGPAGKWGRHHCGPLGEHKTRLLSAYVSITLDLDEAQDAALAPVIEVLDRWHSEAGSVCDHTELTSAPLALDHLQQLLDRTREAMDELRPAFDSFYAALTVEQQERLNGWLKHHHGPIT